MKKVTVVIPAFNPDEELLHLVHFLITSDYSTFFDLIIINDGSKHQANYIFDKIKKQNICVLEHSNNKGKGEALKTAFKYYISNFTEQNSLGIVTADCDGQHHYNDILALIQKLQLFPNTLHLGCRTFNTQNTPVKSYLGNKITSLIFKLFFKLNISDTQTGLRAVPFTFIKECIHIEGNSFEFELKMILLAIKSNYPISTHSIQTIYHLKNKKTNFKAFKDSYLIYKTIVNELKTNSKKCKI